MHALNPQADIRFPRRAFWPSAIAGSVLTWFAFQQYGIWGKNVLQIYLPVWIVWLTASAGVTACIWYALGCRARPLILGTGVCAACLSGVLLIGQRIQVDPPAFLGVSYADFPQWVLWFLLLWVLLLCLFRAMERAEMRPTVDPPAAERPLPPIVRWLLWTLLFVAAWIPYFLTYYPGLMTADSFTCLTGGVGLTTLSNQQPVLYQLWIGLWVRLGMMLGGINRGVALYSLVQMLVMASIFGYGLFWLRRRGCNWFYTILLAVFLIGNPVYGRFSVTMWKDILFGDVMLLFALFLADTARVRGENLLHWQGAVHLCALACCVSFVRNNGLYIVILTGVLLVLWCRRYWKRIVPVLLALVIGVSVVQGPVYQACGIPASPFAESVAIPLQQMSRTVAQNGKLTQQQAAFLNQLLPLDEIKKSYNPYSADKIKYHEKFNCTFLEQNKATFFKTWLSMLGPNLKEYVIAFLMETLGYWNPGTRNWMTADSIINFGSTYGLTPNNLWQKWFGFDLKPWFADAAEEIATFPPTALATNIGATCWAAAFLLLFVLLRRKRWERVLAFVPLAGLWLTIMIATPTFCEFRYMFAFFTTVPFLLPIVLPNVFFRRLCRKKAPELPDA